MSRCPYAEKCWRRSYTRYLQDKKKYPAGIPPERAILLLEGYATPEQSQTYTNKKGKIRYKGLYCENMPQPPQKNFCPDISHANSHAYKDCIEYQKEEKRLEKYRKAAKTPGRVGFPGGNVRTVIPRDLRRKVAQRDKYTCVYCKRHNSEVRLRGSRCVIDHVIPLARGGTNAENNLAFSCQDCNSKKGTEIWQKSTIGEKYE